MSGNATSRARRSWAISCVAMLLAGLPALDAPAAGIGASAMPSGSARIWFYRDYEPYGGRNFAPVSLNGAVAGYVAPDGAAFYRDVPAGHYHIGVISGGMDVNQAKDIDLAPGEEAFVKILSAPDWESGGDISQYRRDTFYVSLVPPQVARAELPAHPLTGG